MTALLTEVVLCCGDEHQLLIPGQRTESAYLLVVPEIRGGAYTGHFGVLHTPTGQLLLGSPQGMTFPVAVGAAQRVAHLSWSSPDRRDYLADPSYAWEWRDAVTKATAQAEVEADGLIDWMLPRGAAAIDATAAGSR